MRNSTFGAPLAPIPFKLVEDEPEVLVLGTSDATYAVWDSAWSKFHDAPADLAAMALAEAV